MRAFLSLVALAFVLVASLPSDAQPIFNETFQVRVGWGDIPTTDVAEPSGAWNVDQRLKLPASGQGTYLFDLPQPFTVQNISCTCPDFGWTTTNTGVTIEVGAMTEAATLTVTSSSDADRDAFAFMIDPPTSDPSQVLIVYAPTQTDVELPGDADEVGLTTGGSAVIHYTSGSAEDPLPEVLWGSIHPSTGVQGDNEAPSAGSPGLNWLLVGIAFILGMVLWAFLVARGAVQTRTRKQVVATSAHAEAARVGKPVLEARRRALMAGLKELEMAKMNKELDDASYDQVKSEFKTETVTTMRAIEEAGDDDKK